MGNIGAQENARSGAWEEVWLVFLEKNSGKKVALSNIGILLIRLQGSPT
jgi:hypothetical protein